MIFNCIFHFLTLYSIDKFKIFLMVELSLFRYSSYVSKIISISAESISLRRLFEIIEFFLENLAEIVQVGILILAGYFIWTFRRWLKILGFETKSVVIDGSYFLNGTFYSGAIIFISCSCANISFICKLFFISICYLWSPCLLNQKRNVWWFDFNTLVFGDAEAVSVIVIFLEARFLILWKIIIILSIAALSFIMCLEKLMFDWR